MSGSEWRGGWAGKLEDVPSIHRGRICRQGLGNGKTDWQGEKHQKIWLENFNVKAEAVCFVLCVWANHLLCVHSPDPQGYKEPANVRSSSEFYP